MKIFYTITLLFLSLACLAQISDTDSLYQELDKTNEDSSRIKIQIQIAELMQKSNPDSAILFYNRAIDLSKESELPAFQLLALMKLMSFYDDIREFGKIIEMSPQSIGLAVQLKDSLKLADIFSTNATTFLKSNQKDSALVNYKKAIKIAEKTKAYATLATAYNNMGVLYIQQGIFDLASESLIKSVERRREGGLKIKPSLLLNIGVVYSETENFEGALDYFEQALASSIEDKDLRMEGMSYQNIGAVLTKMERFEEAIQNLNMSNEINLERNDSSAITKYYIGMADICKAQDQLKKCIENYQLANSYHPSYGNKRQLMFLNLDLANAYYAESKNAEQFDINQTITYAEKAYQLSDQLGLYKNKSESAHLLFNLYSAVGKEKKAVRYAKEHLEIRDSLFSTEKINALTEIQTKYETEKKEFEIQLLEKDLRIKTSNIEQAEIKERQKTLGLIASMAILVLSLIFSIFTYRLFRQKKKVALDLEANNQIIKTQNEDKELLLKEIHHRVKNNLQVISSLLDLQSDNILDKAALSAVEDGQSRVKAMALIHQNLYQNQDIGSISFEEYANQLVKQLASVYSSENKVKVNLESTNIFFDIDTAIPLGLILNELVSNAYKYAFDEKVEGKLNVRLNQLSEGKYQLHVTDNGKGLDNDFDLTKAKSLGLRLVRRLSKQLYGSVEYHYNQGAAFSVTFKDTNQRKLVQ